MISNISTTDDIDVNIKPAIRVYCVSCLGHVFWLNHLNSDSPKYPIDFIEVNGSDVVNFICPFCNKFVSAFDGDTPKFKTSEGWK